MEVLQAHVLQEAKPLYQLRDDVPAELAAVVAKMIAKTYRQSNWLRKGSVIAHDSKSRRKRICHGFVIIIVIIHL